MGQSEHDFRPRLPSWWLRQKPLPAAEPHRRIRRAIVDAVTHFNEDDGWAMAGYVALSMLMALFPFLILVATLAGVIGSGPLAAEVAHLIFDAWPKEAAEPIVHEVDAVLREPRGGLMTISAGLALWFSSNGVEALRAAMNRAYRVTENRNFFRRRAESLLFVVIGAAGMLMLSFLIVLGPLGWAAALRFAPWLEQFSRIFDLIRFGGTALFLVVALYLAHLWLPAGRRGFLAVTPGIVATLVVWIFGAYFFSLYLKDFATYSATYAGLASIMSALVFLNLVSIVLVIGGEINAALAFHWNNKPKQPLPVQG